MSFDFNYQNGEKTVAAPNQVELIKSSNNARTRRLRMCLTYGFTHNITSVGVTNMLEKTRNIHTHNVHSIH